MRTTSESTLRRIASQIHMQGFFHFGPMKQTDRIAALQALIDRGYMTDNLKITKAGLTFIQA